MGRKKRQNQLAGKNFRVLVVSLLAIWAVMTFAKEWWAITFLTLIAGVAVIIVRKLQRPARLQRIACTKAGAIIEQHIDPLVRKQAQLVQSDAYGKVLLDRWNKEIEYFITNHIK